MTPPYPSRRSLLIGAAATPLLAGCSMVGAFNALVPDDTGSILAASDIAYDPNPRQKLDVYVPRNPKGRAPSILFIYGGSWTDGSRSDYAFVAHALASKGFVTAVADYRLVPQVRFPAFVEDAAGAARWMKTNVAGFGGDPARLFVMGHSAGAYNAAMVALDPRFVRAAGLQRQPFRGLIGLSGPYDFLPLDVTATQRAFGQWPRLEETQPVDIARRGAPPAFLATGTDDTTVRPKNTRRLAEVLRKLGTPVVTREYPGVTHASIVMAFARPFRDKAPVLEDVATFVRRLS